MLVLGSEVRLRFGLGFRELGLELGFGLDMSWTGDLYLTIRSNSPTR